MPEGVGNIDISDLAKVVEVVHEVLLGQVLRDAAHKDLAGRLVVPAAAPHPLLLLAVRILQATEG